MQAKFAISGRDRKERMQSWTSSGKSEKENEHSFGSLGLAIVAFSFSFSFSVEGQTLYLSGKKING